MEISALAPGGVAFVLWVVDRTTAESRTAFFGRLFFFFLLLLLVLLLLLLLLLQLLLLL